MLLSREVHRSCQRHSAFPCDVSFRRASSGSPADRAGAASVRSAVGARLVLSGSPRSPRAPPAHGDAHPELRLGARWLRLIHAGVARTARRADALRARAQTRARDALPGSIGRIGFADRRIADRAAAPAEQHERGGREAPLRPLGRRGARAQTFDREHEPWTHRVACHWLAAAPQCQAVSQCADRPPDAREAARFRGPFGPEHPSCSWSPSAAPGAIGG